MMRGRFLLGVAVLVVGAAVGTSIWLNPPHLQRMRHMDERRVWDLEALTSGLSAVREKQGGLPESIAEISRDAGREVRWLDPETGEPYDYAKLGDNVYRLCAVFALASETNDRRVFTAPPVDFTHPAGRACFKIEQTYDKEKGFGRRIITREG